MNRYFKFFILLSTLQLLHLDLVFCFCDYSLQLFWAVKAKYQSSYRLIGVLEIDGDFIFLLLCLLSLLVRSVELVT